MSARRSGRIPGLLIMRLVLAAVGVGVICLSVLVGVLFGQVHGQVQAINAERTHNILASCRDTNQRHDDTVAALDRTMLERLTGEKVPLSLPDRKVRAELAAALKKADPPLRRQAQQGLVSTVLLIDALSPHRDCAALARRQVDTDQ